MYEEPGQQFEVVGLTSYMISTIGFLPKDKYVFDTTSSKLYKKWPTHQSIKSNS